MVFSSLLAMSLLLIGLTREQIFAVVGLTGIVAALVLLRAWRTRELPF